MTPRIWKDDVFLGTTNNAQSDSEVGKCGTGFFLFDGFFLIRFG